MLTSILFASCQAIATPQAELPAPSALLPLTPLALDHRVQGGHHTISAAGDGLAFAVLRLDGRVPFLWPLRGPGGDEMTRAFPMETGRPGEAKDHPHHQSFWFAHGSVEDVDFWHDPFCRMELDGEPEVVTTEGVFGKEITLPLAWNAPGRPGLLKERRTYRFAAGESIRIVEFESTLTAPAEDVDPDGVLFGDTKEGTFALRLRPELRLEGPVAAATILNSEGKLDGDCWGQRAQWVTYDAPLAGGRVSATLMDHTKNLRHPTWWHARDYGLVAANPFGAHGLGRASKGEGNYRLLPGRSITQRYLVVLAKGEGDRALSVESMTALYRWWVTSRRKARPTVDKAR